MLVLSRKPGEKIVINESIVIEILEAAGGRIRIGINAPDDIPIRRSELPSKMTSSSRSGCLVEDRFYATIHGYGSEN